jgi:hypothetical protein
VAAITIAGTALEVADGGEGEPILIGEETRAYAGNLRGSVLAAKRQFQITTAPTLEATWDTLRAAVTMGTQVACSGTVLSGDSSTFSVKVSAKLESGTSPARFIITATGVEV